MLALNIGIVVVRKAEKPTTSGLCSSICSTNRSGGTLTPRSMTVKPAPSSMMLQRFLPMSWTSPLTVPIRNVPTCAAPGLGQQRAQDVERALHRARRDQHLGHEVVAALEARADLLERRDQRVVQHPLGLEAVGETVARRPGARPARCRRASRRRAAGGSPRGSCGVLSLVVVWPRRRLSASRLGDQDRHELARSRAASAAASVRRSLSAATTSPPAPRTGAAIAASPGSSSSIAVA